MQEALKRFLTIYYTDIVSDPEKEAQDCIVRDKWVEMPASTLGRVLKDFMVFKVGMSFEEVNKEVKGYLIYDEHP